MANLEVKWDDEARVVRFNTFLGATLKRAKSGLVRAGFVVERQIKKNLSGKRTPGNPYPGWVTTRLRTSVTSQASSDGMIVSIGPNVEYAAIHEFGGRTGRGGKTIIPARPYVKPAWKQSRTKIIDIMRKAVAGKAE